MTKGRKVPTKGKLLWVGDAVAHTGFSTVTHSVIENIRDKWDVSILGVNYDGDPHNYDYPIYPARLGGDVWGIRRLPQLIDRIQPDIVCILNDVWLVNDYLRELGPRLENKQFKLAVYTPIDSPNIRSDFMGPVNNHVDALIAYTRFGLSEMRKAGLLKDHAYAIPHGIDTSVFYKTDKAEAKRKLALGEDWFIVGNLNRNQPRKRLDLMIEYFAEWSKDKPENVKLYYHGGIVDVGWDIIQLAQYYDVDDRLIITSPNITASQGVSRDILRRVYNSFDVQITTTLGEGWGLSQMEGMACGVPQIVPDWAALAEWGRTSQSDETMLYVPCTGRQVNTGGINTIGGVVDKYKFIEALDSLYYDDQRRKEYADAGHKLVTHPSYSWSVIADEFDKVFRSLLHDKDKSSE